MITYGCFRVPKFVFIYKFKYKKQVELLNKLFDYSC